MYNNNYKKHAPTRPPKKWEISLASTRLDQTLALFHRLLIICLYTLLCSTYMYFEVWQEVCETVLSCLISLLSKSINIKNKSYKKKHFLQQNQTYFQPVTQITINIYMYNKQPAYGNEQK